MAEVYLGLGSNLGDRMQQITHAIELLESEVGAVITRSSVYESTAWGFQGDNFLNCVIKINCTFSPEKLLNCLKKIETAMGREQNDNIEYESRPIDIDILFFENREINTDSLKVPHPKIEERMFVLKPLCEIAPDYLHIRALKTVKQLLENCKDTSQVAVYCP